MTNRFRSRTSWREKLEKQHPNHGKIVDVPQDHFPSEIVEKVSERLDKCRR